VKVKGSSPEFGITIIVIVGLPDAAVKESRDRVSTALINSGSKVARPLMDGFRLEIAAGRVYCGRRHMEITLAKDVEDFLQAQVREGICADATRLVNDVLRAVRDQQLSHLTVTPELEAWLLEAADKPSTPLTAADFAGIRERARGHVDRSAK